MVAAGDAGAPSPVVSGREAPAADVFISYGSDDVALARELRGHLEEGGYRCWMAPDDVAGPATWAEQIVDAIARCQVVLVMVSSVSNRSTHVSKEVDLALEHGKAVLPVRVEDVAPAGALKYLLALAQWIDAFPGPLGPHADEVRRSVAAILDAGAHEASPVTPSPPSGARSTARPGVVAAWLRRRWWLIATAVAVAATIVGVIAWTGGSAGPSTYGDDPALDRLMDRCGSGDMASCDTLATESGEGTEYRLFGETCGDRVDGGGDCTSQVVLPASYGDSPALDALWDSCAIGDMVACDDLADAAPLAGDYWRFGDTCGGLQAAGGGGCVDLTPVDEPYGYGDDPWLDSLWDACEAGDMEACDSLYLESPVDSEYERFGDTCGDHTDGGVDCATR